MIGTCIPNSPQIPIHMQSPEIRKALTAYGTADYSGADQYLASMNAQSGVQRENSARDDIRHPSTVNTPYAGGPTGMEYQRPNPSPYIRRDPISLRIDYHDTALRILEVVERVSAGLPATEHELAVLSYVLPDGSLPMNPALVHTLMRNGLTADERATLRDLVTRMWNERINYNGGHGGGSVTPRAMTVG